MSLPSLVCVAAFGLLTPREQRALLVPPRDGFTIPRAAVLVPRIPDMRRRICWHPVRRVAT
jgi:hypothetical protein